MHTKPLRQTCSFVFHEKRMKAIHGLNDITVKRWQNEFFWVHCPFKCKILKKYLKVSEQLFRGIITSISSAKYLDGLRFKALSAPLPSTFSVYTSFRDPFSLSIVQYGQHANPFASVLFDENRGHKRGTSGDKWYTLRTHCQTQLPETHNQWKELEANIDAQIDHDCQDIVSVKH